MGLRYQTTEVATKLNLLDRNYLNTIDGYMYEFRGLFNLLKYSQNSLQNGITKNISLR